MIYFIQADGIGHIKIGFTDNEDAMARLNNLQTGSPVPLRLLHVMPGTMEDEKNLHRRFAATGVGGEWFRPTPALLALIPEAAKPSCGGVEVVERSVSIRVLTVGRKQFTKSLASQLPTKPLYDWRKAIQVGRGLFETATGISPEEAAAARVLDRLLEDGIWGWVDLGEYEYVATFDERRPYYTVIVNQGERLFKAPNYNQAPVWLGVSNQDYFHSAYNRWISQFVRLVHARLQTLPGLRPEDQLYVGV
jgi:hypothetical protein